MLQVQHYKGSEKGEGRLAEICTHSHKVVQFLMHLECLLLVQAGYCCQRAEALLCNRQTNTQARQQLWSVPEASIHKAIAPKQQYAWPTLLAEAIVPCK